MIPMWKVRELADKVTNVVMNYSDVEAKVREATSDDAWGPHGTLMHEIAEYTFTYEHFPEVMGMLWKRMLHENRKNWRRIYKSLLLLNYLVYNGSDRVVTSTREHLFDLRQLENYSLVDEFGKDQGINVCQKVKELILVIQDDDRLRDERKKARKMKDKYIGVAGEAKSHHYNDNYDDQTAREQHGRLDDLKNSSRSSRTAKKDSVGKVKEFVDRVKGFDDPPDCSNDDDGDDDDGCTSKQAEFQDGDEEYTVERTHTKTTEKITSNKKSRVSRRIELGSHGDFDSQNQVSTPRTGSLSMPEVGRGLNSVGGIVDLRSSNANGNFADFGSPSANESGSAADFADFSQFQSSSAMKQTNKSRLSDDFGNFESTVGGTPAKNVSNVDLLEGLTSGPPPPPHAPLQLMGGLMPGFQSTTGTGEVVMPLSGACGMPPPGNLMMMMGMGCVPGQHQVSGMTGVPGQPGGAPSIGVSHPNAALTMSQNMSMVSVNSFPQSYPVMFVQTPSMMAPVGGNLASPGGMLPIQQLQSHPVTSSAKHVKLPDTWRNASVDISLENLSLASRYLKTSSPSINHLQQTQFSQSIQGMAPQEAAMYYAQGQFGDSTVADLSQYMGQISINTQQQVPPLGVMSLQPTMSVPTPNQSMIGASQGNMVGSIPMMIPQNQIGSMPGQVDLRLTSSPYNQQSNQQFTGYNGAHK